MGKGFAENVVNFRKNGKELLTLLENIPSEQVGPMLDALENMINAVDKMDEEYALLWEDLKKAMDLSHDINKLFIDLLISLRERHLAP